LLEWVGTPPVSHLEGGGVRQRAEASLILRALLAVLGLAVVVGVILSVISVTLLKSSGILPEAGPSDQPSNVIPQSSSPATGNSAPPTTQPTHTPTGLTTTTSPHAAHRTIQLAANPPAAGTYERINLVGSYNGVGSPTLQVQRFEGGQWVDFPTTASVSGGQFSTYIETGHTGVNRIRMLDPSTGQSSNVVEIQIS
jgi:hypothetical protein